MDEPATDDECSCLYVEIGNRLLARTPDPDCPQHAGESPDDPDHAYDLVREREWDV